MKIRHVIIVMVSIILSISLGGALLKYLNRGNCEKYEFIDTTFQVFGNQDSTALVENSPLLDTLTPGKNYLFLLNFYFDEIDRADDTKVSPCSGGDDIQKDSIMAFNLSVSSKEQSIDLLPYLKPFPEGKQLSYKEQYISKGEEVPRFLELINDGMNGRGDFHRIDYTNTIFLLEWNDSIPMRGKVVIQLSFALKSGKFLEDEVVLFVYEKID